MNFAHLQNNIFEQQATTVFKSTLQLCNILGVWYLNIFIMLMSVGMAELF